MRWRVSSGDTVVAVVFVVLGVHVLSSSLLIELELDWSWMRASIRWRRASGETCAVSFGFVLAFVLVLKLVFVLVLVLQVLVLSVAAAPWMRSNIRLRRSSGETSAAAGIVAELPLPLSVLAVPPQLLRRRIVVGDISVEVMLVANIDGPQCRIVRRTVVVVLPS